MSMNMNGKLDFLDDVEWLNKRLKSFWVWACCFQMDIEITHDHQVINCEMNIIHWLKLLKKLQY